MKLNINLLSCPIPAGSFFRLLLERIRTSREERLEISSGILVSWLVPRFSSTICTQVPISEQDNDKKYITYSGCNNSYSCIDHVIISETASRLKIEFKINQSIINTSDHKSIQCNIKTNNTSMNHTVEKHTIEAEYLPKIKWDDKDHIKIYQNNF